MEDGRGEGDEGGCGDYEVKRVECMGLRIYCMYVGGRG
jgi:hypothetical protein